MTYFCELPSEGAPRFLFWPIGTCFVHNGKGASSHLRVPDLVGFVSMLCFVMSMNPVPKIRPSFFRVSMYGFKFKTIVFETKWPHGWNTLRISVVPVISNG